MASSYDKVVKLACKPKAAPPKSKYMDPIIAATWSEDGAVHDVCKALSPRFREPNAIVVFKALIVLHTMIRNGATDNVLQYLSSSDVLRLRNISAGHWEGYNAPQNLQNYSIYLDTRIRAYRDLKHDAIRVQSETNRDMRNSQAIEEGRSEQPIEKPRSQRKRFGRKDPVEDNPPPSTSLHQRSKTLAGRKLRVMTVEKGLLRETKIVQKMIDALVECRFYLDDLEDELNITALRMLVKDILILFQACNEGVINVLEHYFEMSKIDAKDALAIYRHFCKETERVVEYLGVAKKLQNLLNVPIPNLRHAPVSLAGSLEEYLNDPNFEQNRIEYKTNKEAADRNARLGIKASTKPPEKAPTPKPSSPPPAASTSTAPAPEKPANSQAMVDFFSGIEEEQESMFNPQTNSPSGNYFQQQATFNPFAQQQLMTGAPFGQPQVQQPPIQMQATGAFPQQQAVNPFGLQPQAQQPQAFGNFLQPQPTAFLQPQATGAPNPFRQSMLFAQSTGMSPFAMGNVTSGVQPQAQPQPQSTGAAALNPFPGPSLSPNNPFPMQAQPTNPFPVQSQTQNPFPTQPQSTNPFPTQQQPTSGSQNAAQTSPPSFNSFSSATSAPSSSSTSPFVAPPQSFASHSIQPFQPTAVAPTNTGFPIRPASAPLKAGSPHALQALKTHQTGSRNPFGVPVAPTPPVPKVPTLFELSMGMGHNNPPQTNTQPSHTSQTSPFKLSSPSGAGATPGGSTMSSIASGFSLGNDRTPARANTMPLSPTGTTNSTATGSTFSSSLFSPLSSQPTATSATSANPTGASPSLQPHMTGFSGIKAFKPSSSFGAALLESLPPIPQSAPTTPGGTTDGVNAPPTSGMGVNNLRGGGGSSGLAPFSRSTVGVGLRPQATGSAGVANPFRASMFAASSGPTGGAFGGSPAPAVPSLSASSSMPAFGGAPPSSFGSQFGAGSTGGGFSPGSNATPGGGVGTNAFSLGSGFGAGQGTAPQQQNGTASLI